MNFTVLKKLAKSDSWQTIYNRVREIGSLKLFDNTSDLSGVQVLFLNLLQMYSILFQDLAEGKDYLSEEVIDDDLRTEAYLILRKELKNRKGKKNSKKREVATVGGIDSVVFREK